MGPSNIKGPHLDPHGLRRVLSPSPCPQHHGLSIAHAQEVRVSKCRTANAATVRDILQSSNTLCLLQAGSWAAGVGITISGIPKILSYFAILHKIYICGRGFNTTGFKKCFSKTGSASIIRIKTKGKSTVVSAHAIKVCGRRGKGGTAALIFNLSVRWW